MSAAMTPGIQPKSVRIITISTEPQPLSKTERGGKTRQIITRDRLIYQTGFSSNKDIKSHYFLGLFDSLYQSKYLIIFVSFCLF